MLRQSWSFSYQPCPMCPAVLCSWHALFPWGSSPPSDPLWSYLWFQAHPGWSRTLLDLECSTGNAMAYSPSCNLYAPSQEPWKIHFRKAKGNQDESGHHSPPIAITIGLLLSCKLESFLQMPPFSSLSRWCGVTTFFLRNSHYQQFWWQQTVIVGAALWSCHTKSPNGDKVPISPCVGSRLSQHAVPQPHSFKFWRRKNDLVWKKSPPRERMPPLAPPPPPPPHTVTSFIMLIYNAV